MSLISKPFQPDAILARDNRTIGTLETKRGAVQRLRIGLIQQTEFITAILSSNFPTTD
jgi:hypothetical protein